MHHQKGVAIHFLIIVGPNVDGKPILPHGGINVYGHGLRGRSGHARLLAGLSVTGALLAKTARVHEQQKGSLKAGEKDFPFQFDQLGVDLAGVMGIWDTAGEQFASRPQIILNQNLIYRYSRKRVAVVCIERSITTRPDT